MNASTVATCGLLLSSAACDVMLGIGPVPTPEDASPSTDGALDAPLADASADVVIDVPPLPSCGTGFSCTAAAPGGWSGPIAFAAATGGTIPACSGVYGGAGPSGHSGLSAGTASCICSCPTNTTGTSCPGPTLVVYSGTSCNNAIYDAGLTTGVCSSDYSGAGSMNAYEPSSPTSIGSCSPTANSTNVPTVSWSNSYAVCDYQGPSDGGGCEAGTLCVETPGSSYNPKPCVYQAGDVPCPGAPYTYKTTFTTGLNDTRTCSTCTCTPTGGSCSANLTAYTGSGCGSGALTAVAANGTCTGMGVSPVSAISTVSTTLATCAQSGGAPVGSATTSGPVTVCCQQ